MTTHKAIISKESDSFYAMIVRIDRDGQEHVLRGYNPRHFASQKNAENSTQKYMKKWELDYDYNTPIKQKGI